MTEQLKAAPSAAPPTTSCADPHCVDGHVPGGPDGEPEPCPACTAPAPIKEYCRKEPYCLQAKGHEGDCDDLPF